MADNPVAIEQLRVMADYFINAELPYFEELREAFKLLKHTGCRIQEIFEIERWTVLSGYNVILQPQKGNNVRYITLNSDFNNFLAAIQNQYKPFLGRTYSQLQNLFYKINPYGKLYSSTKEITNYFFRYLFVRELDFAGLTIEEIAETMGYTSTTAVHNYLDATLTSTIEVPVESGFVLGGFEYPIIELAGYKIVTRDLKFNDGGSGIFYNSLIPNFVETFGYLYSYEAAQRILSQFPAGWILPSKAIITAIANLFGGPGSAGPHFRENSLDYWISGTHLNTSGLSFRGIGYKNNATFYGLKTYNYFHLSDYYSATNYSCGYIRNSSSLVNVTSNASKLSFSCSVRAVKPL